MEKILLFIVAVVFLSGLYQDFIWVRMLFRILRIRIRSASIRRTMEKTPHQRVRSSTSPNLPKTPEVPFPEVNGSTNNSLDFDDVLKLVNTPEFQKMYDDMFKD